MSPEPLVGSPVFFTSCTLRPSLLKCPLVTNNIAIFRSLVNILSDHFPLHIARLDERRENYFSRRISWLYGSTRSNNLTPCSNAACSPLLRLYRSISSVDAVNNSTPFTFGHSWSHLQLISVVFMIRAV